MSADAEFTVYVLGAGASHEGGVPLASQILPVGYNMLRDLEARGGGAKHERIAPHDYLARLSDAHARAFRRVYDFIAEAFQGRASADELDLANLPTLDELWALLEIAYSRRAAFGRDKRPHHTAHVRASLMALLYHVLVGCTVQYPPEGRAPNGEYAVCYDVLENPYARFVELLREGDAVIALNYDILLDAALSAAGREIDYGTDVAGARTGRPGALPVLKLHGSFNWLWCPTCNTIEDFGRENVARIPIDEQQPDDLCPLDGTPREHVIIPPSLVKSYGNFHIQRIWDSAATLLRACARLVFIGYSMSDSDVHVKYLVKQSTSVNPAITGAGEPRVTVVNQSDTAWETYRRLFGANRVTHESRSFGEWLRGQKPREADLASSGAPRGRAGG